MSIYVFGGNIKMKFNQIKSALFKRVTFLLSSLPLIVGLCLFFAVPGAAQYAATDFLIADFSGNRIAVYNQSLVFQRYLDTAFPNVTGLDLLSNGNLVAAGQSRRIKVYNPAGTIVTNFTNLNLITPLDVKASAAGLFYVGTQDSINSVAEFSATGTYNRSFGAKAYAGVVIFGNTLWAGGDQQPGIIDVYNLMTGEFISTFTLDNGQVNAVSMHYSASTNTILMADFSTRTIYERTTTGAFVRQFTGGGGGIGFGVTRGPGGDVYATSNNIVSRWTATGTFVGNTSIPQVAFGINMLWAGSLAPTAAGVSISGRVTDGNGNGLRNAVVTLTDANGEPRSVRTSAFGYYRFDDVEVGETYIVNVRAKQFTFANPTQVITVNDNIDDLDFIAQ